MVQVTPPPDTGVHARVGLDALFDPRSVAVVGASDNPEKWGYWLASGALSGRDRRAVHLVNHRGGALDGEPFLPDLASLPVPPEHVVVAVPPRHVRPVITDGLAAGARCFTVITSGGATAEEERALAELVTARGARLLGPNCMGVVDTTSELRLSWGEFPSGGLGLVSQSGNLALEIGRLLARSRQGFSRFVSLGNQRDIDAADALESLIAHGPTRALAAYIEDFRDGRRLARVLAAAHAAGKPVLLLTVGRSAASGRAAASHTGALVSARATVEAVCRDAGALLLDTAGELVDTAVYLLARGCTRAECGARARRPAPSPAQRRRGRGQRRPRRPRRRRVRRTRPRRARLRGRHARCGGRAAAERGRVRQPGRPGGRGRGRSRQLRARGGHPAALGRHRRRRPHGLLRRLRDRQPRPEGTRVRGRTTPSRTPPSHPGVPSWCTRWPATPPP